MIEKAYLAAGCFWGVEYKLSQLKGVTRTAVGFAGGHLEDPSYQQVCSGVTGHAETVYVEFETDIISYKQLLREFFAMHDPTQFNRQGPDVGAAYRSVIFYVDDVQKQEAQAIVQETQASLQKPIVTILEKFNKFFTAEGYHQQYLTKKNV